MIILLSGCYVSGGGWNDGKKPCCSITLFRKMVKECNVMLLQ